MRQSKNAALAIVFAIVMSLGSAVGQADTAQAPATQPATTTTPLPTSAHHTATKAKAHRRRPRVYHAWVLHVHGRLVIEPVALGRHLNNIEFGARYWPALRQLWQKESGWNPWERAGDACGIPQALPCSKIPNPNSIWSQVKWGLGYIKERYGNPIEALRAWLLRQQMTGAGWY